MAHISVKTLRSCHSISCATSLTTVPHQCTCNCCLHQYGIHHDRASAYVKQLVNTVADISSRNGLRSARTTNYALPRLCTKFGERGFSHVKLEAWNYLPWDIYVLL